MTKRAWVRRSEAQWRSLLERHAESGLTIDAFCAREGVSKSSLARWRALLPGSRAASAAFVELPTLPTITPALCIELDLGAGIVLRITR